MVEEAAGTCMSEECTTRRKPWKKRENRVYETTPLLAEGITPKLDTVRAGRCAFMQYQKASAELERLRERPAHVRMGGRPREGRTQEIQDRRTGTQG